jgi:1-acyl-sn-glycerol-3-phosphate acyltransferase
LCTQRVPFVKFKIEGFDQKKFEKPCIIISNHQSHIDLTGILGLHPNIIALTNKWVWNLPFYGLPLRFADFYPIADNMENSVDKLEAIVKKGYSILIFPEGTRSEDCSIKRFHKGAFYLAEKLNLDILPITLHGFGHILPKKELCLRKGKISIHIGDLIKKEEYQQMGGYQNVSKWARKEYISRYNQIAQEIETPHYWANRVAMQYIYKGMNIEWEVKRNLKRNNYYSRLIDELKQYKNVKFVNCGYGELPLLTSMVLKDSNVYAFEMDNEKFSIARNCANIPSNLKYGQFEDVKIDIVIDVNTI